MKRPSEDKTADPLKWLEAMAVQLGDGMFAEAAEELRNSREALREIEDYAGVDRDADWCRDRAREARFGR